MEFLTSFFFVKMSFVYLVQTSHYSADLWVINSKKEDFSLVNMDVNSTSKRIDFANVC